MVANLTTRLGQLTSSPAGGPYTGANKIINGDMVIDQRNAGASVTPTSSTYCVDRWKAQASASSKYSVQQNAGSVTILAGMPSTYIGVTSLSAYSLGATDVLTLYQTVEGLNCVDLLWGTVNAQAITVSFWVRSSLTGTFGGGVNNSAANRSYPFTYTINSANTWEYKTVTIPGDTTGTWLTTNGAGIYLYLGIGVGTTYSGTAGAWAATNYESATGATNVAGTNGATIYWTAVKVEKGSIATPFVPDDRQVSLAKCQRYFQSSFPLGIVPQDGLTYNGGGYQSGGLACYSATDAYINFITFPTQMRAAPTTTIYASSLTSGGAGNGKWGYFVGSGGPWTAATTNLNGVATGISGGVTSSSAFSNNSSALYYGGWAASAEL